MRTLIQETQLDTELTLVEWRPPSPRLARHDARGGYVERFWLPVLGPSTVLFLRRAASLLERFPAGRTLPARDLARALGLGERTGHNGPLGRTIGRAIDFGMARCDPAGPIGVRTRLPDLSPRQVRSLPDELRLAHAAALERASEQEADPAWRRALRLALSLAQLGETEAAIERQLLGWGFQRDLARRAAAESQVRTAPPADAMLPASAANAPDAVSST